MMNMRTLVYICQMHTKNRQLCAKIFILAKPWMCIIVIFFLHERLVMRRLLLKISLLRSTISKKRQINKRNRGMCVSLWENYHFYCWVRDSFLDVCCDKSTARVLIKYGYLDVRGFVSFNYLSILQQLFAQCDVFSLILITGHLQM